MKSIILTLAAFAFFVITACNKKLEIQPQNSLTNDQIKTSSDVEAVLFGAYNGMQGAGAFGEGYILTPDLIASDSQVVFVGTFQDYQAVQHKSAVATNGIAQNLWGNSYTIINLCNTVLDKISLVDTNDKNTVQGEALFMRAAAYFELVGLYGKPYSDGNAASNLGVPLVLTPTYTYDSSNNSPNKPPRATVAATYTQIVKDLLAAIGDLPASNVDFRADVNSARAILSRVYLSMGDYADAAIQADSVITSGGFSLTGTFDKAFNNVTNSTEDVFAIQQTTQSNAGTTNNGLTTFYATYPVGRGDAQIDTLFFDLFEPTDLRGSFVTAGKSIAGDVGLYTNKWMTFYRAIPVVRLAEMYLTRGEGNLMSGGTTGDDPLADINLVRARSGASVLTTVAPGDFIEERFRELSAEGDRFWTIKRWKLGVIGYDYDNDRLILPIPQSEIDVNKNLVQNGGY